MTQSIDQITRCGNPARAGSAAAAVNPRYTPVVRGWLVCVVFLAGVGGCRSGGGGTPLCAGWTAAEWTEANALFQNDPDWLGADGAYSVDLGGGRVLWVFGDTFVAKDGSRDRGNAYFIRNSVAIQTGYNPAAATISFHWGSAADGTPASFYLEQNGIWYWPAGGARLGDRLILFYSN